MRLLHFVNQRLTLTDFSGRTIPPYAILSHRWSENPANEVLFEDLGSNTWEKKAGYPKIMFCAGRVAEDGLQYFWIDTCCIDKWNRDERSKAINSMFRWYQNAVICYVYLPDVSVPSFAEDAQHKRWEVAIQESNWFKRGWTLQELIAPVAVEFFSADRQKLGDRESLKQVIHEITGIPVDALQGHPLHAFSISDRRKWLGDRQTKEPEDTAYCLLGILNVSIPLIYGEGKEKALSRLQEELQATKNRPSIIPFSQNDRFVGREANLAEIEKQLFADKLGTRIAITGEGGTGKTQLALEVAHRTRQKNKHCSVFWIDASGIDSLLQAYSSIAEKLSLPGWDDEKADSMELVRLHLSEEKAGPWLLLFDNLDDVDLLPTEHSARRPISLAKYLPQSELGSILFTTTNSKAVKTLALQAIVELQEMTPDTAERMLENHVINRVILCEKQEMRTLLRELSYLPLAIVQAAAYFNMNDVTIKEYRSRVGKHEEEASKFHSDRSMGTPQTRFLQSPVTSTLLAALHQIRQDHPRAADYLCLMACLDRRDIPLDALGVNSAREREDAIRILNNYALVTRRPADDALDLHRLVYRTVQAWLQKQEWYGECIEEATLRLVEVFPSDDHMSRSRWRRLLPHARYILSHGPANEEDDVRMMLVWKCAMALHSDGRYLESELFFKRFMETSVRMLGEDHPSTLTSMANLASTYMYQGRSKEAEELESRVMETNIRVLGVEDIDTLMSMGNLATTYRSQGRWKEAEKIEVRVMETSVRVLGEEHPCTLTSMANLASTYRKQGRWKKAEELQANEWKLSIRVLGEEHPDTLISMANLTATYSSQGRWKEAEELGVRVTEIRRRVLGEEHPETLTSIADLAFTYTNQGRLEEAEELQAREWKISERLFGEKHPETINSLALLALIYCKQGRRNEAEELEVRVVETRKAVLGEEHPDTLTAMNNLAFTWKDQDRDADALQLMKEYLELQMKVLGDSHPNTLAAQTTLLKWSGVNLESLSSTAGDVDA